jgi:alpha-amylase/alpha-mannosidase (GH57 family)/DNA-binding transcriptional regulator GbsR (MarR family)
MAVSPKMKDAFVAIHGHFYQPPRENPWMEAIETEEGAHPFHDWNERITFECYRPNAYARIVDDRGKILGIINNYSSISFNFGPTLLSWIKEKKPFVYQKIIEADREGLRRFGHGNAMAQAYNHMIMPLANERDKETEVLWGIADFEKQFHRKAEAMWLPETAVDYPTLQILVKYGMRYLILSPFQALRVRPFGGKKWTDVSQGKIDTTQPYRCFIKDISGKKVSDQFIDLFFYDGVISKEAAFGDLLKNGDAFCERFAEAYQSSKKGPQLIHIATDGETYGHHKKFGDMALAYALKEGMASHGFEIINYGAFLKRFPPVYEVEIDEGPKGEGSSWSCAHGVARWKEDCGCSTGGKAGWNQKWRKPLREALDLLRDELSMLYEKEGEKIFKDLWEARNGYIEVILDRSPERMKSFFDRYGVKDLDKIERLRGLKLLEMQHHALLMYTSCGWFFADLAGLETVQIFQYAGRAIQLAEELTGQEIEGRFLEHLVDAKSNLPEMGNGKQIYQRLVKPKWVTLDKVVNHFAISSLFDEGGKERKLFSYRVERMNYEKIEKNNTLLVVGQVRVTSEIIPEPKDFLFGLIPSMKDIFQVWVSESKDGLPFDTLREKGFESIGRGEEEMAKILTSLLGNRIFTVRDAFREERQTIFQKLIQKELDEHRQIYAELFDRTKQAIGTLVREGLEIPFEIRMAAEVTLSDRLLDEVKKLRDDFKATLERGEIDRIVEETKQYGFHLRKEEPLLILNEMLKERMKSLQKDKDSDLSSQTEKMDEMISLLERAERWSFELSKEEAQDLMEDVLNECLGALEKCWWAEGVEKPFPHNLITLAEKLGFNVERFSKVINAPISAGHL